MPGTLKWAKNALRQSKIGHSFGELLVSSGKYDVEAAPGQLDMIGMAVLPADHVVVDTVFKWHPISTSATVWGVQVVGFVLDLDGSPFPYDLVTNFILVNSPSTDLTADGIVRQEAFNSNQLKACMTPLVYDIWVGVWFVQPATVPDFIQGSILLDLFYRPVEEIDRS